MPDRDPTGPVWNVFDACRYITGHVGGGWALEILTFLGPKWLSPNGSMPFHRAQKTLSTGQYKS